jgi:hypothetical protein
LAEQWARLTPYAYRFCTIRSSRCSFVSIPLGVRVSSTDLLRDENAIGAQNTDDLFDIRRSVPIQHDIIRGVGKSKCLGAHHLERDLIYQRWRCTLSGYLDHGWIGINAHASAKVGCQGEKPFAPARADVEDATGGLEIAAHYIGVVPGNGITISLHAREIPPPAFTDRGGDAFQFFKCHAALLSLCLGQNSG